MPSPSTPLESAARRTLVGCLALGLVALPVVGAEPLALTASPPGARVFIIEPVDGATVQSPVTVRFGVEGLTVSPAGKAGIAGSGHHHLLIDATLGIAALDRPIPATAKHLHFGGGQTETSVELPPGRHTLQLVFGDYRHIPHGPPVISTRITINVR